MQIKRCSLILHEREIMESVILKMACKDKKGIIAAVTSFIHENSGNIVTLDEFVDSDTKQFFMRIEWNMDGFLIEREKLRESIEKLMGEIGIDGRWELFFSDRKLRMAIFVSKYEHCLHDILLKHKAGELNCEIPLVISNHKELKEVADMFGVDFRYVGMAKENKEEKETEQLKLLQDYDIDFIVLARYMQILSGDFITRYENKIINIHHSFLPAFEGARPYHRAFERGVKIIGATAHFVNKELDKGPIIQQGVTAVSHKETVDDLAIKGREIERKILTDAIKLFIEHRIFVCNNRTIILS